MNCRYPSSNLSPPQHIYMYHIILFWICLGRDSVRRVMTTYLFSIVTRGPRLTLRPRRLITRLLTDSSRHLQTFYFLNPTVKYVYPSCRSPAKSPAIFYATSSFHCASPASATTPQRQPSVSTAPVLPGSSGPCERICK